MTHVANAFKYATGIIVVFASTNKRSGGSSVLFWASVLLNSLYSFYWDIRMDWGLFTSTRTIIQENRRYDKVWYYVAVALDFVLRISWSLKLSASYGLLFDGEYSSLLSQVLELFRRTMWTCIRVEYVLSLSLSPCDFYHINIKNETDTRTFERRIISPCPQQVVVMAKVMMMFK